MSRASGVLFWVMTFFCFAWRADAQDSGRFKRVRATDISGVVAGRTLGDDAHWSYHFNADGSVESMDLGRTKRGVWRIVRGELCLDFKERGKTVFDCYELWVAGSNVRFMRDGVPVIEGSILRD